MKSSRLLLLTIFTLCFATIAFAQDDVRPTATWQVQKYDVSATLPSADTDRVLTAKADLSVKNVSTSPATTLSLRISPNAVISTVTVNGANADFSKREERVGDTTSLQRVSIRVPSTAPEQY